jgi:hypothetical protein
MVPIFCYETFAEKSMQQVANKTGIDRRRQAKYDAHIAQLEASGQHEEAAYFRRINPFDEANRPPDPRARIPQKELDGFKGNFKAFWVEMIVGHRAALERTEGRGLRKRLKEQQRAESAIEESVNGSMDAQPHAPRVSPVGAASVPGR